MSGREPQELVVTTYDWVPEAPRGHVRDIRVTWALEEAGLPYRVESVPFQNRGPEHFAHQPFGQVPWLTDGDLSVFESGAILLHLAEKTTLLMPADAVGRKTVLEWVFAALNSIEMASVPWSIMKFTGEPMDKGFGKQLEDWVKLRMKHMDDVLAKRVWLADTFSVADILMADVLRLVDRFDGLAACPNCKAYVARATARPAFVKAHAAQMAHFAKADQKAKQ
jgi:glutathione S-transferase